MSRSSRRLAGQRRLNAASLNARVIDRGRRVPLVEPGRARSSTAARPTRSAAPLGCRPAPPTPASRRLGGTDLWYLVLELPPRLARRVQARGDRAAAAPASIEDPLNPRGRQRPLRRQLGLPGAGYETPELDRARPRGRRARSSDLVARPAPRSGAGRGRRSTSRPASRRRRRPLPAARRPRRRRLPPLRRAEDRARQPHPSAPRAAAGRRLQPSRRSPRRVRRRPPPRPLPRPRSSCRALEAELPAGGHSRPGGASWAPASAPSRPFAAATATRAASAACCCSRARSPSPTSAAASGAGRSSQPVEALRRPASSGRPGGRQRAGVRELRHVRVADLREPLAGPAAPARPAWTSASSRRATATTGRTGATASATGCLPAGCS